MVDKYRNDKNYYISPLDAKQEGAFVLMGLLYDNGDLDRSMAISMRCGADSDCNPSSTGGVLFTALGMSKLPARYHRKLDESRIFSYTAYNFPALIAVCDKLARQALAKAGGKVEMRGGEEVFLIPANRPVPSRFEDIKNPGVPVGSMYSSEEMAQIKVKGDDMSTAFFALMSWIERMISWKLEGSDATQV